MRHITKGTPTMDAHVKNPTQMETERSAWNAEYERRWSTLDQSSPQAKLNFRAWLDGFSAKAAPARQLPDVGTTYLHNDSK
jgi:hypothetical protein